MKLRSKKKLEISRDLKLDFFRKIFGFTLFVSLASGFKFNFIASLFIGIILSAYILITDALFDILSKILSKLYNNYLKDTIDGLKRGKEKIQND